MRIRYKPVCRLQLRHDYYLDDIDNKIKGDFWVHPTPSCQRILQRHNLIFRPADDGFTLYGQVIPDNPEKLLHELGEEASKLTFWLEFINHQLLNITELPGYKLGREIFYINNLNFHLENIINCINDNNCPLLFQKERQQEMALSEPVELITTPVYTYTWKKSDDKEDNREQIISLMLKIYNLSGTLFYTDYVVFDGLDSPDSEYRFDLSKVKLLSGELYWFAVNRKSKTKSEQEKEHTENSGIYYDTELNGKPVFSLLELYNTTNESYKFLSPRKEKISPYVIWFESRKTFWRYIVIKKYDDNINLEKLSVKVSGNSSMKFSNRLVDGEKDKTRKIYLVSENDSHEIIENICGDRQIILYNTEHDPWKKIHDLPVPTLDTPLQKDKDSNKLYSDIYIYV